jgi:atypical dual specificity phosphatase
VDAHEILQNLIVGACPLDSADVDRLKRGMHVTAVLNVQTDDDFDYWRIDWPAMQRYYRDSGIELRRVPVRDFDREDLRRRLTACVQALEELLRAGHTVYVHCTAGMNRSPSTVIAYLHWIERWGLDEAINHVTRSRSCDPYVDAIKLASEDRAKQANPGQ